MKKLTKEERATVLEAARNIAAQRGPGFSCNQITDIERKKHDLAYLIHSPLARRYAEFYGFSPGDSFIQPAVEEPGDTLYDLDAKARDLRVLCLLFFAEANS